jgi:hypothetical protein
MVSVIPDLSSLQLLVFSDGISWFLLELINRYSSRLYNHEFSSFLSIILYYSIQAEDFICRGCLDGAVSCARGLLVCSVITVFINNTSRCFNLIMPSSNACFLHNLCTELRFIDRLPNT